MPETNVPFGGFELREKELAVRAAGLEMRRFTNDHVLNDVVAAIAGALAIRRGRG